MKIDSKKPDRVLLSFTHLGGGLASNNKGEANSPLQDFTIAGDDRKFVNAQAEIQGDHVVVWSPQVAKPVAVRYDWSEYPLGNLWSKAGLPASPFRTDDFAVMKRKGTDSAKP